MKMDKTIVLFVVLTLLGPGLLAQQIQSEADFMSRAFSKDKKTLITEYLKLSDSQGEKFWPLYEEYEKERANMGEERYKKLAKYQKEYGKASEEQAAKWLDEAFTFRAKYMTSLQEYTRRIQAQVGGKIALQFYELEAFLRAEVRDEVYSEIPLIETN